MVKREMSLNVERKRSKMLSISVYSRYTPKVYLILQLSVKWLFSVMLNARDVSGKKVSKVPGVVNQVTKRGKSNFMLLKCRSIRDNFCAKKSS